jgi:AbrB family looped-hinge helix DNA binding protein
MADMAKKYVWTNVDKHGRIVIPAEMRDQLGLKAGTRVRVRLEDGELSVMSAAEGLRRVQEMAAKYIKPGRSLMDELIAERRAEATRE